MLPRISLTVWSFPACLSLRLFLSRSLITAPYIINTLLCSQLNRTAENRVGLSSLGVITAAPKTAQSHYSLIWTYQVAAVSAVEQRSEKLSLA